MECNGRGRLLVLATLMLLAFSGWRLPGLTKDAEQPIRTDGPVRLAVMPGTKSANPLTKSQLEARAAMFSLSPKLQEAGLGRDRFLQMTNTGQKTIRCYAYGAGSPIYRVEIQTKGNWTPMPLGWSSSGGVIMLKRGQSLRFPVLTPTATACRIGIRYEQVVIPETIAENALCIAQRFFLPEKSRGEWFLACSDVLKD